jgi:trehalose-phosphatase
VIFLDYDGTLAPTVEEPSEALLPENIRELIKRLSEHWTVVIMTGRPLNDARKLVGLDNLVYVGSHGLEMMGPGDSFHETPGKQFRPVLDKAEREAREAFRDLDGVHLQRKPFSIAIHYRLAGKGVLPELETRVDDVAAHYPELVKIREKDIFELRPRNWNKGRALLDLLERFHIKASRSVPVYIGDDSTEEDVFEAVAGRGIGILVSNGDQWTPATYTLRDPSEVAAFLEQLLQLFENTPS